MKRAVRLPGGACCLYHGVLLNDVNVVPIDPAWYLQWEQSSHYYLFLDLKHTAVGTSLLWLVQWKVSLCFVILAFSKLHRFCQHVIRRISVASVFPRAIGTIQRLLHYHDAMVWNAASRFYDRGYLSFQQLPPTALNMVWIVACATVRGPRCRLMVSEGVPCLPGMKWGWKEREI